MTQHPKSFNKRLEEVTRAKRRPGRPATPPLRPIMAEHGLQRFLAGDAKIIEAMRLRDGGFEMMVRAGMTSYQIAKAVGVAEPTVTRWIREAKLPQRRVVTRVPTTRDALTRGKPKRRSVLLG